MVNEASPKYSAEEMLERAFYRIAWNVKHMWEETGHSDTRLFDEPVIPDKFVLVGQSKSGGTYREHIVPRVFICHECHKMFEQGESIEAVARFIRRHLKIVLISKEESDRLNLKANLGLREKMPNGWVSDAGDVFERLKIAGVEYDLYPTEA